METIKRYGVKMGDLSKDAAFKNTARARRAVPKKFLETPGRIWLKRMIRVTGLFSFVVTALVILSIFVGMIFPGMGNEATGNVMFSMIAGLFFVNHMGLLLEMGGDSSGRNWFAKGAGLMWLWVLGSFLIAILIEIAKSLF